MKKYYLTTPLYYVNDVPHIGHAYTTIAADILARWQRLRGESVFFLTGTDEHGAKIADAATKNNEQPQAYTDRIAGEFQRLWTALNISYSDFIRTTQPRHKKVVQAIFEKLKETGDIYKGVYEDWYCIHDESYFSEAELVNGKCPSCGRDVQKLKEESYFFKLSAYEQPLLQYYKDHPDLLSPKNRASEITNFVSSGLQDLSVSRTRVKWGIPVESDPEHTVYVWFDALINYISVLGYDPKNPDSLNQTNTWPCDVHLVGKEIFRFHTVIWPAMLMALKLPLPKKVFAHGWWTVEGTKMSKSLGNVVDPHSVVAEYGVDAFRYFLFREVPFGSDGDYSEKSLLNRFNVELANNLGNLLQRTVTILVKQFDGVIPSTKVSSTIVSDVGSWIKELDHNYDELNFGGVLEQVYRLMVTTNQYIDEKAPWKLTMEQKEQLSEILMQCLHSLKLIGLALSPFMPEKMQLLWERLGEAGSVSEEGRHFLNNLFTGLHLDFKTGQKVIKSDPLFMRKGGRWK